MGEVGSGRGEGIGEGGVVRLVVQRVSSGSMSLWLRIRLGA